MKGFDRRRSVVRRTGIALVVALSLSGQPLAAQAARDNTQRALPQESAKPAPALATETAARVGVSQRTRVEATAPVAAQPSDNTVKWAIIIGVAVLAALLIVALAD